MNWKTYIITFFLNRKIRFSAFCNEVIEYEDEMACFSHFRTTILVNIDDVFRCLSALVPHSWGPGGERGEESFQKYIFFWELQDCKEEREINYEELQ